MAVSHAVLAAFGAYAAGSREREPLLLGRARLRDGRLAGAGPGQRLRGARRGRPTGTKGTPDDQFTCTVDTSAVAEQAWQALCRHRTQAADVWYRLLGHQENWRVVFAAPGSSASTRPPTHGDPHETSLVEAFGNG